MNSTAYRSMHTDNQSDCHVLWRGETPREPPHGLRALAYIPTCVIGSKLGFPVVLRPK